MNYQVLARKWRPHTFHELVGQEHILRMLSNALSQNRIHHAYLFSGTRGVGKTTIARILAKSLNCEMGITPTPCGTCATCQAITNGQFLDLYEIDAASRTKVEDTRELLENVNYPPTQGRYKIYLIDEVHMLSNHSFNALLKTLEEPPAHVKFLLATTEPKRLPITILSRCLQFHLKRIPKDLIAKHLSHICHTEQVAHDEAAVQHLAHAADGSMRDALSLLDQAIAYGDGRVNANDVNEMLGNIAQEDLSPLLMALAEGDAVKTFDAIKQLTERGPDFGQLLELLISLFHQTAVHQLVPNKSGASTAINLLAKKISPETIQLYYQIALLGRRDLPLTPTPELGFEMTLLRMLAFEPNTSQPQAQDPSQKASPPQIIVENTEKNTPIPTPLPQTSAPNPAQWADILPKLELTGMAYALAANCALARYNEHKIELTLSVTHQPMLNPKLKERLNEAITRYFKRPIQLDIHITQQAISTPAKQQEHRQTEVLANAREKVLSNPNIQRFIELYDASIEVNVMKE